KDFPLDAQRGPDGDREAVRRHPTVRARPEQAEGDGRAAVGEGGVRGHIRARRRKTYRVERLTGRRTGRPVSNRLRRGSLRRIFDVSVVNRNADGARINWMARRAERFAATGSIGQAPIIRSIAAGETAVLTGFVPFEANPPIRRVIGRI